MPLGRNWRAGDASGGQLLPLWWWRTDPQRRAGFIIPYYWDRRPGEQRDGIFPLWYRKVTPETAFNQVTLYFGCRSPTSRYDALIPLWHGRCYWRLANMKKRGTERTTHTGWCRSGDIKKRCSD